MAEQTFTDDGVGFGGNFVQGFWLISLGLEFNDDLKDTTDVRRPASVILRSNGRFDLGVSGSTSDSNNLDLSNEFEQNGSVEVTVGNRTIRINMAASDISEPYSFLPSNSNEVTQFVTDVHADGGSPSFIATFRDFVPSAPSFTDDTGDDQSWTQNTAITPVTIPRASGAPAPSYTVAGRPAGITVTVPTETADGSITGTPTGATNGTITITATNSEGSDDWTLDFTTAADTVAPEFADDTGDDQDWFTGVAIAAIAIPRATGTPNPTYAQIGAAPAGINVSLPTNTLDGSISGTPTAVGTGTITVRATNSVGMDDWTVDHETRNPLVLSDFAVPSGYQTVFAALITIGQSGEDRFDSANSIGSLEDGDLDVAADLAVRRIRVSSSRVRLNRIGAGAWPDYIETGGPLHDARFHMQSLDGVSAVEVSDLSDTADILVGIVNIRSTTTGGTAFIERLNSLSSGDRVILAMTRAAGPTPVRATLGARALGALAGTLTARAVAPVPVRADLGARALGALGGTVSARPSAAQAVRADLGARALGALGGTVSARPSAAQAVRADLGARALGALGGTLTARSQAAPALPPDQVVGFRIEPGRDYLDLIFETVEGDGIMYEVQINDGAWTALS